MISTAILAQHRTIADKALPDTATLTRPTRTTDGMGGWTSSYAAVGATYPCRVGKSTITPTEAEAGRGLQTVAYYVITFSAASGGPTVLNADRITVGSRVFEVVKSAEVSYQVAYSVLCRQVQ